MLKRVINRAISHDERARLGDIMTKPGLPNRWELSKFEIKTLKNRNKNDDSSIETSLLDAELVAPHRGQLRYSFYEIFVQGAYDVGPLPARPVIVDCGANIGIATFYLVHHYVPRQLIALEPDPTAYSYLVRNVARNGWRSVSTLNVAVGDDDRDLEFFFNPKVPASLRMSGIRERLPVANQIVQCRRLSDLMPGHVDLLKLDVEGMECDVLRDLTRTGAISAVDRMAIEYHHHLPVSSDRLAEFLGIIEEAGFGYQLAASRNLGDSGREYQDVMVYAHRK